MKRRINVGKSFVYISPRRAELMRGLRYYEVYDRLHCMMGTIVKVSRVSGWEARIVGERFPANSFREALQTLVALRGTSNV